MWGLWLVADNPEVQWQPAECQLANSRLQCHTKSYSFLRNNISKHMTFTQQPTGWLQQCATPLQSAQKKGPCAWGLCPVNSGGHKWWHRCPGPVPSKVSQPWERGTPSSLFQQSGHLKTEGVTVKADRGNEIILCSKLLLCQGYRTLSGCWKHQTLHEVHGALNFT